MHSCECNWWTWNGNSLFTRILIDCMQTANRSNRYFFRFQSACTFIVSIVRSNVNSNNKVLQNISLDSNDYINFIRIAVVSSETCENIQCVSSFILFDVNWFKWFSRNKKWIGKNLESIFISLIRKRHNHFLCSNHSMSRKDFFSQRNAVMEFWAIFSVF